MKSTKYIVSASDGKQFTYNEMESAMRHAQIITRGTHYKPVIRILQPDGTETKKYEFLGNGASWGAREVRDGLW